MSKEHASMVYFKQSFCQLEHEQYNQDQLRLEPEMKGQKKN